MTTATPVDIADAFEQGSPIDEAMNAAVRQAVERHRQAGLPLVIWRNGRVEQVAAEALEIEGTGANGNSLPCP